MRAFEVGGDGISVRVNEGLSLTVRQREGRTLWATSRTQPPTLTVRRGNDHAPAAALGAGAGHAYRRSTMAPIAAGPCG